MAVFKLVAFPKTGRPATLGTYASREGAEAAKAQRGKDVVRGEREDLSIVLVSLSRGKPREA